MSSAIAALVTLEVILMIGIPIATVLLVKKRWSLTMRLALAGAATFVASQILHIPANSVLARVLKMETQPLIIQTIVLGLSAGIFEEIARYLVYRFWQKDARSWRDAVFFGLGHGGIEAILTGLLAGLTFVNVIAFTRVADPATLGLSEEVLATALAQVESYWTMPAYMPLLAVAERVMALILHVSLSTLVAWSFHARHIWPVFAAILWHATANAVAVYANLTWGPVAAEGLTAAITLVSVMILWQMRRALPGESTAVETA
ncbi:MAG: YhfC family intramembrane metalloprotease [Anaerolineae bacterium]|nr:YhfC family intramembrane metalloprotease [Anaerolineae bacterium]